MGFFSDPAASHAPIEGLPSLTLANDEPSRRSSRRTRRGSVGGRRPRRSSLDDPSDAIPALVECSKQGKSGIAPLRRSSTSSSIAVPRRRSSLLLGFVGMGESSTMNASMNDNSMQDHLDGLESFVRHLKTSDKKERKKILKMATNQS